MANIHNDGRWEKQHQKEMIWGGLVQIVMTICLTISYRSKFYCGSRKHEQQHSHMATESLTAEGPEWCHTSSDLPGALGVWVITAANKAATALKGRRYVRVWRWKRQMEEGFYLFLIDMIAPIFVTLKSLYSQYVQLKMSLQCQLLIIKEHGALPRMHSYPSTAWH